jgi:hypothetical protein
MNTSTQTETMNNGGDFPVQLRNGNKAQVFVRQLPARQMSAFLKVQDDEAGMIELACTLNGKPLKPEFVDDLAPASHAALVAEIERVNDDFFEEWGKRQRKRAAKLKAAFDVAESPESGGPLSPSPNSSLNPQSSAA